MVAGIAESFFVQAGEGRLKEPFRFLGETIFVKVSGADTAGRFAILEEVTPPQGGPPLHTHQREDEWLYVLEGELLCEMDGRQRVARAGESVFVRKGVPHTFQNVGSAPSRILALVEPAGTLEQFFSEMASACADGPPDMASLASLFQKQGLDLVGPPLALRAGASATD
jgi:uncharacterized cupin superfamily protein